MNEFDITCTYTKGDLVLYDDEEYVYDPKECNQNQSFSIGLLPIYGFGWMTSRSYKNLVILAMKEYAKYKLNEKSIHD